jgi:hypothetical protein
VGMGIIARLAVSCRSFCPSFAQGWPACTAD